MCFAVNQENKRALQAQLELWTGQDLIELGWRPRRWINAFAHPLLPIVFGQAPEVALAQWGLVPAWVKDETQAAELAKRTLNAKSETMFSLPSFRDSAPGRRCVVPVNGFYEYQHRDGGKTKQPYAVRLEGQDVMLLGGIWAEWRGRRGFAVCTMPANRLMAEIHNSRRRMPVVVPPARLGEWLSGGGPDAIAGLTAPDDELPLAAAECPRPSDMED